MADNSSKRLRATQPREIPRSERVERVKTLRRLLGPWTGKPLPQEMFAELVGVSPRTAVRWEAGEQVSADDAVLMAQYLEPYLENFTLDWLYLGVGSVPRRTAAPLPDPRAPLEPSPAHWVDFDDLVKESGLAHRREYPVSRAVACSLLNAAAAELWRIEDESLRESLFVEIQEWRNKYGCE